MFRKTIFALSLAFNAVFGALVIAFAGVIAGSVFEQLRQEEREKIQKIDNLSKNQNLPD